MHSTRELDEDYRGIMPAIHPRFLQWKNPWVLVLRYCMPVPVTRGQNLTVITVNCQIDALCPDDSLNPWNARYSQGLDFGCRA